MLIIRASTILTPDGELRQGAVAVEGATIATVGPAASIPQPAGAQVIDANGLTLTPGFIDLQVNGGFGHDFTADPTTIWPVGAQLTRHGVTGFLPTIITSPPETIIKARQVLAQGPPDGYAGARPLGLHVEGPFLNPAKKGAHNPAYLRPPSLEAIDGWTPSEGVRLVTLAPELPGALQLIEVLCERGVVVSAGHSLATYDQAMTALQAGVRYGTHLFNAMPPLGHREPGLAGALLTRPEITVGLIADGIHVHPALIQATWQILGSARLNLITDAMAALGMPFGKHLLGDLTVTVDESGSRLANGTLAGCVLSLDAILRNLIRFTGCTLQEAMPTITTTPATLLGLAGSLGQVAPGYSADLVLLTADAQVAMTVVGGKVVHPEYGPVAGDLVTAR